MNKILLIISILYLASCSSGTTDFVNSNTAELEETLFQSNQELINREKMFRFNIESSVEVETGENKLRLSKINSILRQMNAIDHSTAKMIQKIEKIKLDLLRKNGENIQFSASNPGKANKLVWSEFDKENPLLPIHLNLEAIDPGKYPKVNFLADEKPKKSGMKLWQDLIFFRSDLVEMTGSYQLSNKTFQAKTFPINNFKNQNDLYLKVSGMIEKSNANKKEEAQVLQDLYISLTKKEKDKNRKHWITANFGNLPLVMIISNLSMLQNEILEARSMAIAHISIKSANCGNQIFRETKFIVLAPDKARRNQEVKLNVFLAAFEYYLKPEFTFDQGEIEEVKDGIATLKTTLKGEKKMHLSGTVSLEFPYGQTVILPWEKEILIEN